MNLHNNLYTNLLRFTNRLFGSTALLNDNVPDAVQEWIYNIYGINLKGKSIYLNLTDERDICIVKTTTMEEFDYLMDEILVSNKEVRVILINSDYFDNMTEEEIYKLLITMYTHMITDLFSSKSGSLYKVNYYAPFILTLHTMDCFNLTYSVDWMSSIEGLIILYLTNKSYSVDANVLLNNGAIVAILNEVEQN